MGFPDLPLGERMHAFGVVLCGWMDELRWLEFLAAVATAIGMESVGNPKVWTYPFEGKGGTGQTILLPITESFLALDTWKDHSGAYLFICSCRPFDSRVVDRVAREFGMEPSQDHNRRFAAELHLK
jgi:S-adenosylmethionine/arginine decarboxylase-like enzyme